MHLHHLTSTGCERNSFFALFLSRQDIAHKDTTTQHLECDRLLLILGIISPEVVLVLLMKSSVINHLERV